MTTQPRHLLIRLAMALALLGLLAAACSAPGDDEETAEEEPADEETAEEEEPAEDPTEEEEPAEEPEATEEPAEAEPAEEEPASDEPISIGLMAPFTGPFSVIAADLVAGWEMYWEERGSTEVAGREVVWTTADDANDPATGITQANGLVSQEGIDMLVGPVTTAVGAAVAEEMARQDIPVFTPALSDDNVTQRSPLPGVIRIAGWSASQVTHVLGAWAAEQGYATAATICFDLQFGYEHCGGFANTFTDAGGEVTTQLWHAIGEQDYATFVTQLREAAPDVVFVGNSGGDAVRFVQAYADFGLKDEIPLVTTETVLDQSSLRELSADAALGLVSAGHWAEGREDPATADFTEAFLAREERMPSYFAAAMYAAAEWLVQAIEDVDGDLSDTATFVEAVRAVDLGETPLGPVELDDRDHPIQNIYVREVAERDDGLLWNVPIETYEEVSQFWTYDPEEYLAQPAYSREYQGLDWP